MRRVPVTDLQPGMVPVRDVLNNGALMLRGRRPLNEALIERLQRSKYRIPVVIDDGEPFEIRRLPSGYSVPVLEKAHGHVQLEGDVFVELFVDEEVNLFVRGNLSVRGDVLPYATIVCTGSLHVSGQVMGATLVAGTELTLGVAGSLNGHPTMLSVMDYEGVGWLLKRDDQFQEQRSIQSNLEKTEAILSNYARRRSKGIALKPADRQYLEKVIKLQRLLRVRLSRLEQQLGKDRRQDEPEIRIFREVRPHVCVRMGDVIEPLEPRTSGCMVHLAGDHLQVVEDSPGAGRTS